MATKMIEPFDGGDFGEYLERLEFHFCANNIGVVLASATAAEKKAAEKRMTASLVSSLSKSVFTTLKSLILPDKIGDKKYSEICDELKEYYRARTTPTVAAFQFRQCTQRSSEAVADFANRLKRAAVDCKFEGHRDRALREQLITGITVESIRKKMLTSPEKDIDTFVKTLEIALREEMAIRQTRELTSSPNTHSNVPVHQLKSGRVSGRTHSHHTTTSTAKPERNSTQSGRKRNRYRCGSDGHLADKCYRKATECKFCHKKGHLERVCMAESRRGRIPVNNVIADGSDQEFEEQDESFPCVPLFTIVEMSSKGVPPYAVQVQMNDMPIHVRMEIDTGNGISILNRRDYEKLGGSTSTLSTPTVRLMGFSGSAIKCLGETVMNVCVNGGVTLPALLRIVDNNGPSLLGRDMLTKFRLPWEDIFAVKTEIDKALETANDREEIIAQFPTLFDTTTVGRLNTTKMTLRVNDERPVFMRARKVPFAISEKYETALKKLEQSGVIRPVEHSWWASPTVPVVKPDGSIRICADYGQTINANSELEKYPLPTIDEIRAKLSGGTKFTKIDLSQAYHQLELDEQSCKYTTINTHRGLFEYVRLPFGIQSAVSMFQRTMEIVLAEIEGCIVYIDDIVVTGKTEQDHRRNLARVLQRLQDVGMKIKAEKFHFMLDKITYLGHTLSAAGITPSLERTQAMANAKPPSSVNELQSFIGSANYGRKFIPRFTAIMIPLYALLRKNAIWKWDAAETNAFNEIKSALCSAEILAYYSNDKRLKLQTDASGAGLGAVLLQEESTGTFRPISYASRVLAKAELNYSNIERELLALVFGVTTFRQYLLGRQFMLETDHQPLVKLFGCTKGVPILVSSRLKTWKMTLAGYDYVITYIPGRQNFIADFMSRKPVPGVPSPAELTDEQVLFVETEVTNASSVSAETQRDPVLKKALQYTLNGWPENTTDQELLPYFTKHWELSVADNILLWNERVVVPESLRELLLNDLHYEHSGAVRMKRLARRYVWWPRIDKEIEETATQCQDCQEQARMPAKEYGSWSWPTGPWQRIHIDFAGPFMGKMFLVIVDAYSRFLEIVPMDRATSTGTIAAMQRVLGIFGLPSHVVSDNGAQFTSEEFKRFLKANGILHTCTAPGHPATNGLAERYVGYFKSKLRAMGSQGNLQTTLYRFLFSHRTTPLASGKTPAELLLNRQPRTRFDLLKHDNKSTVDAFERNLGRTPEF